MVTSIAVDDRLEIHEAAGAFARLEQHLQDAGFFSAAGREPAGRCADVYLGYGLSEPLRRSARAALPEPLRLPLAALHIRDAQSQAPPAGKAWPYRLGAWEHSWSAAAYATAVRQVQAAIAAGEVYQVNLVQHLSAPFGGDPRGVAAALARFDPIHRQLTSGDDWAIVSASPELFLARRGRRIWTMPIKGTRPRGGGRELGSSGKDAAEHMMIVDLERNDLGRICEAGSVHWPRLMRVETMAGVEHLVSLVEGTLREDVSWSAALTAMFPGGSVTGAPKIAALDHINALEPVGRGASMGAVGTVWPNGDFDLALTIRTFAIGAGRIHLWVGGGIVWDSDPLAEVEESWVKARPLLEALEAAACALTA